MSSFDLLEAVLPPEGRYCVFGVGKYPDQRFVDTRAEVDEIADEFVRRKVDAFFGCAKFGDKNNRTHENALYFRALWMDIDCGPTKGVPDEKGIIKGYLDQTIGLIEFKKFCKAVGLPQPILVSSGYGIHAYWLLDQTTSRAPWEALSHRLRELCVEQGLIVDPSVFEASRVLRIPGTYNFKNNDAKLVEVLNENTTPLTYEQFKELLGAPEPKAERPAFIPTTLSPMMEALMGNKVKRFKNIMIKSAQDVGCPQLLYCYENQATIDEPLWRSALSITAFCTDSQWASHKMSNQYPNYDEGEVDEKVAQIQKRGGPHHCATFQKLNPTGCEGCVHRGKIKSPIVLGIEVEESDDTEIEVQEEDGEVIHYQLPEYPFPYFRGKNGGVYKKPSEEEEEPILVYEHDFYVVKRMRDPDAGEVILFRAHLPLDGVREFTVPMTAVSGKEEMRKALAFEGIVAHNKKYEDLAAYAISFIKNLQYLKKAEMMRTQFGWVESNSKFILGDREITKDGVFYSPPSEATKDVAPKIHVKGSFEKWKEAFNMYARPGLEPHAFAALTGFGSPLLKFTGLEGAIINVIHKESGSGKSTALFMCNSICGQPKELTSMFKDTYASKIHTLGVMNNLANTIDEITNMSGMEFSDLAYSISQGRGKNRMNAQTNTLRTNNTIWQGITLCSANASFYEKLGAAKNTPDGESMRLLEYEIKPTTVIGVQEGKEMFDHQLRENYGHAGEPYMQYLVNNLEDSIALVRRIQARLDKEVQFTAKERFWSALCACNIAGGLIAMELGLHNYNMRAIYEWLKGMLSEMRHEVRPPNSTPLTILGEFLNSYINNALVVNGEVDARTSLSAMPLAEPRGELLIRYEPDNKALYVAAKPFKDFCVKQQINYKNTLKELTTMGIFKEGTNKRMSKGMKLVSPPVRVLHFDASSSEYLQLDTLVQQNDNRDGDVQH